MYFVFRDEDNVCMQLYYHIFSMTWNKGFPYTRHNNKAMLGLILTTGGCSYPVPRKFKNKSYHSEHGSDYKPC